MYDLYALFQLRRKQAWIKGGRYAGMIAKTLQVFPLFFLLAIYFGYKALLTWIPEDFPLPVLLAILFTWVMTTRRYRTFIQPADPLFLLAAGEAVTHYFKQAFRYNLMIQFGKIVGWCFFFSPLLYLNQSGFSLFFTLIALLYLQGWNTAMRSVELANPFYLRGKWVRVGSNLLLLLWLFDGRFSYLLLPMILLWTGLLFLLLFRRATPPSYQVQWETWIGQEEETVYSYYRFANYFVDVPQVGNRIRPRQWLAFLERWITPKVENTYLYLYIRTFFRYDEPFGSTLRLTITGIAILLILRPSLWLAALLLLGVLSLTGIQLPWVRRLHRFQPWFRLYPLPEAQKGTDLTRLIFRILLIQSTLIVFIQPLLWTNPLLWGLPLLSSGWLFSWLLSHFWLSRRPR